MDEVIAWIEDSREFDALAGEWDDVAARSGSPFVRHAWLAAWWHAFSARRRLFVCTARRDGALAAALALWRRGSEARSLANAHTPAFAPISVDETALRAVLEASVAAAPGSLVIGPLPADHPAVELLATASRHARRLTWIAPAHDSPVVDLAGGAEAHRQRLARDTRRELERLRRKVEREHDARFDVLVQPADLDAALARGFELESSGWKGRRGTAILSSPATSAFYHGLARRLAAQGALRLSTLDVGGQAVAFDFGIVSDGALWIPKGGYDETFRRYAPGLLLLWAEIQRAYELGLERVELLGHADAYKLKFATRVRPHAVVHSHAWRPAPTARLAYARFGRPAARALYRRARRRRAR